MKLKSLRLTSRVHLVKSIYVLGAVARSVAMLLEMQVVPKLIPA